MTATVDKAAGPADPGHTGIGRVARVIGPVVDVEFGVDDLPGIYNALEVEIDLSGEGEEVEGLQKHTLTLEVSQHIGDNIIRAISMQPTDGLVRGAPVRDTGGPITVPVGDVTLGHVFNTTGDCLNLKAGE